MEVNAGKSRTAESGGTTEGALGSRWGTMGGGGGGVTAGLVGWATARCVSARARFPLRPRGRSTAALPAPCNAAARPGSAGPAPPSHGRAARATCALCLRSAARGRRLAGRARDAALHNGR